MEMKCVATDDFFARACRHAPGDEFNVHDGRVFLPADGFSIRALAEVLPAIIRMEKAWCNGKNALAKHLSLVSGFLITCREKDEASSEPTEGDMKLGNRPATGHQVSQRLCITLMRSMLYYIPISRYCHFHMRLLHGLTCLVKNGA